MSTIRWPLALTLLGLGVTASAQTLLPSQAGDQVPTTLIAHRAPSTSTSTTTTRATPSDPASTPRIHDERQPIQISWALPADAAPIAAPTPFARPSRSYTVEVAASELGRGVSLPLSAPGALIRLSPSDALAGKLAPEQLQLNLGGQRLSAAAASARIADAQALRAAGMDAPAATVAFQLQPALGTGVAVLSASGASGRYLVQVLEARGAASLEARADQAGVLLGQPVQVTLALRDGDRPATILTAGGVLRAPDGSVTPLRYRALGDGRYAADVSAQADQALPGLWQVDSFVSGRDGAGQTLRRDGSTVFAVSTPDARFSGGATTQRGTDGGLTIDLAVDAASASRYAASAVLYGRVDGGEPRAIAYAQSAAWLAAGAAKLSLHFDAASLRGATAPFELRDLRLQDQPALGTLERRALALRIDH